MQLLSQLLLATAALFASPLVNALALPTRDAACTQPTQRVSWHDMKDADKKSYLKAAQCLLSSPAKTKLPGVKTRWDDLASLHQLHALQIHSTATFLPYHRYFLHIHGFLLKECGYNGPLAYWNEPRDAGHFSLSPVFDSITGFGKDGQGAKDCVGDGPFANATVNIGPGFTTQPRCINRKINDGLSVLTGQIFVDKALAPETYWEMQDAVYSGPHLFGHASLVMMDGDSITSAGDPLFMLHHGWVDKMWADWQSVSPSRLLDISGPNAQDPAVGFTEFPGSMEDEATSMGWGKPTPEMLAVMADPQAGDVGPETTLNHVLTSFGIIEDVTIADIMDTKGNFFCYVYV